MSRLDPALMLLMRTVDRNQRLLAYFRQVQRNRQHDITDRDPRGGTSRQRCYACARSHGIGGGMRWCTWLKTEIPRQEVCGKGCAGWSYRAPLAEVDLADPAAETRAFERGGGLVDDLDLDIDLKDFRQLVIETLSPAQLELVDLRYYEEMSMAEIARTLGVSREIVRVRLQKARELLRAAIEDH